MFRNGASLKYDFIATHLSEFLMHIMNCLNKHKAPASFTGELNEKLNKQKLNE